MVFSGNIANNWHRWEQRYRIYTTAAEFSEKDNEVHVAILLQTASLDALEIYETFTFEEGEDDKDVETVLEKFRTYFQPLTNEVSECFTFCESNQLENETVDHWVTELKSKAMLFDFGNQKDKMICDL